MPIGDVTPATQQPNGQHAAQSIYSHEPDVSSSAAAPVLDVPDAKPLTMSRSNEEAKSLRVLLNSVSLASTQQQSAPATNEYNGSQMPDDEQLHAAVRLLSDGCQFHCYTYAQHPQSRSAPVVYQIIRLFTRFYQPTTAEEQPKPPQLMWCLAPSRAGQDENSMLLADVHDIWKGHQDPIYNHLQAIPSELCMTIATKHSGQKLHLVADSAAERDEFIAALVTVVKHLNTIQQHLSQLHARHQTALRNVLQTLSDGAAFTRLVPDEDTDTNAYKTESNQLTAASSSPRVRKQQVHLFADFGDELAHPEKRVKRRAELYYCDSGAKPPQRLPHHCIILDYVTEIVSGIDAPSSAVSDNENERALTIVTELESWYFIADSVQMRDQWIEYLEQVLELLSDETLSEGGSEASTVASQSAYYNTLTSSPVPSPDVPLTSLRKRPGSGVNIRPPASRDTHSDSPDRSQQQQKGGKSRKNKPIKDKVYRDKAILQLDMRKCIRSTCKAATGKLSTMPATITNNEFQFTYKNTAPSMQVLKHNRMERCTLEYKEYAPTVFARLRRLMGIHDEEWLKSVAGDSGYNDFVSSSKSGAFFFYTGDQRYMIKSEKQEEVRTLLKILPQYYRHFVTHPDTLLSRITGLYRLKKNGHTTYFFLQSNVFHSESELPLHVRFDLKGSTLGRAAKPQERLQDVPVLKDKDYLHGVELKGEKRGPTKLHLGSKAQVFLRQLKLDSAFLAELNIMDYSLLVGIHYKDRMKADVRRSLSEEKEQATEDQSEETKEGDDNADNDHTLTGLHLRKRLGLAQSNYGTKKSERVISGEKIATAKRLMSGGSSHKPPPHGNSPQKSSVEQVSAHAQTSTPRHDGFSLSSNSSLASDAEAYEARHRQRPLHPQVRRVRGEAAEDSSTSNSSAGDSSSHQRPLYPSDSSSQLAPSTTDGGSSHQTGTSYADTLRSQASSRGQQHGEHDGLQQSQSQHSRSAPAKAPTLTEPPGVQQSITGATDGITDVSPPPAATEQMNGHHAQADAAGVHHDVPDNALLEPPVPQRTPSNQSYHTSQRFHAQSGFGSGPTLFIEQDGGIAASNGNEIYYCGIIDLLQTFNAKKHVEYISKAAIHSRDAISCVPPEFYAERFYDMIAQSVD